MRVSPTASAHAQDASFKAPGRVKDCRGACDRRVGPRGASSRGRPVRSLGAGALQCSGSPLRVMQQWPGEERGAKAHSGQTALGALPRGRLGRGRVIVRGPHYAPALPSLWARTLHASRVHVGRRGQEPGARFCTDLEAQGVHCWRHSGVGTLGLWGQKRLETRPASS